MAAPPQLNQLLTPLAGPSSLVPTTTSATIPHLAQYYAATIPASQPALVTPSRLEVPADISNPITYLKKLWNEYKLLGFVILIVGVYVYWNYFYKENNNNNAKTSAPAKALNFMDPQQPVRQIQAAAPVVPKKQTTASPPLASSLENDPNFTPLAK